jgi:beta-phosphoglucomutase-like phosphatase (HAD superfamily)
VNRRDIALDRSIGAIEVIASVDDVTHSKPDPEIYLQAANRWPANRARS